MLAVLLVATTTPAHWFGLRDPWVPHEATPTNSHETDGSRPVARTRAFIFLAISFSAAAFTVYASVINLVPLLIERGLTPGTAAVALGLGGIGQVAGRLGFAALGFVAATSALLGALPGPTPALVALAVLLGVARGIFTLIQATAVSDRWGVRGFGKLNGLLSAPVLISAAIAPFLGSYIAELTGGQGSAFLILALVATLAAAAALGTSPLSNQNA